MAKEKISIVLDGELAAAAAQRAKTLHMNRSEYFEDLVRRDHAAQLWADYRDRTVPALNIDTHAQAIYEHMIKVYRAHG